MTAPILTSAVIRKEVCNKIFLYFDKALDLTVKTPLSSFQVNFGKFTIVQSNFRSNSIIELEVSPDIQPRDEIFITYTPPLDLTTAIRTCVKDASDMAVVKRAALREIINFDVSNLMEDVPLGKEWDEFSNVMRDGETTLADYPIKARGCPKNPTPDDYILMYGLKEAIQISNIDDASATTPNYARIMLALQDACALLDNYVHTANQTCMRLVTSNRRRTACIIARYYLDSVRRRKDVTEDYERCIKEIDDKCDSIKHPARPDDPIARTSRRGLLRTFRIPQYYNPVSGKGYSAWWVDSAGDLEADWRNNRGYYNPETNLSEPNQRIDPRDTAPRLPDDQPDDGGGIND